MIAVRVVGKECRIALVAPFEVVSACLFDVHPCNIKLVPFAVEAYDVPCVILTYGDDAVYACGVAEVFRCERVPVADAFTESENAGDRLVVICVAIVCNIIAELFVDHLLLVEIGAGIIYLRQPLACDRIYQRTVPGSLVRGIEILINVG